MRPAGDLIPWTIGDQFQDDNFVHLSGVRVVRIATHPQAVKSGYGSRALDQLSSFFEGKLISLDENCELAPFFESQEIAKDNEDKEKAKESLNDEKIKPKKKLKPLLRKLSEIRPPALDWVGVSYGLTRELYAFWRKNGMETVYIRQT